MSMTGILIAAAAVGGTGILIGFLLGIAGERLKVEVDEREEKIMGVLPGNNCGGCGYPGCSGLAAAIVKGEAPVGQCPVGGSPVAAQIGEIMGMKSEKIADCYSYARKKMGKEWKRNGDGGIVVSGKDGE